MRIIFADPYGALSALYRQLSQKRLARNTGWMLLSEGFARISRLLTILVMAATLSVSEYGVAILALTCHELIRTLTRIGAGTKIIQCSNDELPTVAGNAYLLNWSIALLIAMGQYTLAPWIAAYYQNPLLAELLQWMAISYLIYPIVAIRACWVQRSQRMKHYSLCSAASISTDNIGTAVLLLAGAGLPAIAYAKVISAMVWAFGFALVESPTFRPRFNIFQQYSLIRFSTRVLCSELLRTLRCHADVLLAGRLLAPELFGVYSFAKSAGVGLAQSLSNAYLAVLYPKCADEYRAGKLRACARLVLLVTGGVSIIFVLQSLAAPIYIPVLFDAEWENAASLVAILCLSAVPAIYLDSCALLQRVQHKLNYEILLQLFAVGFIVSGIVLIQPDSAYTFAITTTCLSISWLILAIGITQIQLKPFSRRIAHSSVLTSPPWQ